MGLSIPKLEHGWGKELERQHVFAINQVPQLNAAFLLPGEMVARTFPQTINILLREGGCEFSADCLEECQGPWKRTAFPLGNHTQRLAGGEAAPCQTW